MYYMLHYYIGALCSRTRVNRSLHGPFIKQIGSIAYNKLVFPLSHRLTAW